MNNTNSLISSDNKGFASLLMEKVINGPATLPGTVSSGYYNMASFPCSHLVIDDVPSNTSRFWQIAVLYSPPNEKT